jgi:hypothetical protein
MGKEQKKTPLKRVREYCKNTCCAGDTESWKNCSLIKCELFPLRFGTNENKRVKVASKKDMSKKAMFSKGDFSKSDVLEGEMSPEVMNSLGIVQDTSKKGEKDDE